MSAPDTNIRRQTRRHRGPLVGIIAVLFFAGLIGAYVFLTGARDAPGPTTAAPDPAGGAVQSSPGGTVPAATVDPSATMPAQTAPASDTTPMEQMTPNPSLQQQDDGQAPAQAAPTQ
jgi:hypothetical protein